MGLKEDAAAKLQDAYTTAQSDVTIDCPYTDFIDFIIDNTHLTYKYVLFTALLPTQLSTLYAYKKNPLFPEHMMPEPFVTRLLFLLKWKH